jgi:hypothetical protein
MPLRIKISLNNIKSKSVSLEKEREYTEQNFRNMVWFFREELLKIQNGMTMEQIGFSQGEIGNLKRQGILKLTSIKERTYLVGKYRYGNGRSFILTEKAKLALKEMAVSEN